MIDFNYNNTKIDSSQIINSHLNNIVTKNYKKTDGFE